MTKKMTKGHRFVSGLIVTLLLTLCFACVTPTRMVYANSNEKKQAEDANSNEKKQAEGESQNDGGKTANDLNDVSVSMGSDGKLNVDGLSDGTATDTWNAFFEKSKVFLIGFAGIGMLIFIGLFIKNFIALGAAANNPTARSQALTGCLWTGISAALCGSVTLLVGLFWNAFK